VVRALPRGTGAGRGELIVRTIGFWHRLLGAHAVKALVTVATTLLVTALAGELVVFLVHRDTIGIFPRHVTDVTYNAFRIRGNVPFARYRHKSTDGRWQFAINSRGFRDDREFGYAKPPGRFRVLVLGDSFTIGYEVARSETYAAVIEDYLARGGVDAEVINAGMAGNSNAEEYVFLKEEGIKYQPDVVILGFFRNDLVDNVRTGLFGLVDGEIRVIGHEYLPAVGVRNFLNSFPPYRWLSEHSYLHNYLNRAATIAVKNAVAERRATEAARRTAEGDPERYREELAAALIGRIAETARAAGARFVVLDVPTGDLERSIPPGLMRAVAQAADAVVVAGDLLAKHRAAGDLYRPHGQGHWTPLSHRIAGEELGRLLLEIALRERADSRPPEGA
jgi:hypothetical protein